MRLPALAVTEHRAVMTTFHLCGVHLTVRSNHMWRQHRNPAALAVVASVGHSGVTRVDILSKLGEVADVAIRTSGEWLLRLVLA